MATLAGNTIASTYPLLLKIDSNGIDGTLRTVQDGDATDSVLSLSTTAIKSTGDVLIDADDKALVLGADQDASIFSNTAGEIFFVRGQDYSPASGDVEGWIAMTLGNSSETTLGVFGGESGSSNILVQSDGGDDDSDKWKIEVADGAGITFNYASTGSYVTHLKLDANSKISLSNNDSGGTSGADSTSGNTIFGYLAGTNSEDGSHNNTLIGHKAAGTGTWNNFENNVVIGTSAGAAATTADQCVIIGHNAGTAITGSEDLVLVGQGAGSSLTDNVDKVIFIGRNAGSTTNSTDSTGTVGIGHVALTSLTDGFANTAIGFEALTTNTQGDKTVAIGYRAGKLYNPTANYGNSVFIGHEAGSTTTTARKSTVIGDLACSVGTMTGEGNTVVGHYSGADLAAGTYNTFVGLESGANVTSGDFNTSLGCTALKNGTVTGDENVAIGHDSGYAVSSGAYNTMAGGFSGAALTTGSSNTLLGYRAMYRATTAADSNVAIGYESMSGNWTTADVNNCVSIGRNSLSATLTSEVSGTTMIGAESGVMITTGIGNTGIGYQSLAGGAADSGTGTDYNVAIGYQAAKAVSGNSNGNIVIGYQAMESATENDRNVVIGYRAGASFSSGEDGNILIGYSAGSGIRNGDTQESVIIGKESGTGGAGGSIARSVAIGAFSLQSTAGNAASDVIAIGHKALKSMTTGSQNTCVGFLSGEDITTHSANTFLGYHAGLNVAGDHNTCIGASAGDLIISGEENICIGSNTDPSANDTDNAIVIGFNITGGGNQFSFGKASNVVSNTYTSDAAFSRSSDERLKTDIKDDTLGLDFIKELKTKTFKWKPSNEVPKELTEHYSEENNMDTDVVMHGMIAQEVKEALDKAGVSTFGGWSEKSDGSQDISREMFVIPLIKAVQELSAKVTELENK